MGVQAVVVAFMALISWGAALILRPLVQRSLGNTLDRRGNPSSLTSIADCRRPFLEKDENSIDLFRAVCRSPSLPDQNYTR
jgi:hypothetical protein